MLAERRLTIAGLSVRSGVAAALAVAPAAVLMAQALVDAGRESVVREGVRIFSPDYFAEFDPIYAMDLVYRTPGFDPQETGGGRGLSGVRSNILINGERPPPKGQSARQQLGEMPIERVVRVELIDAGARLDVDMQGYSQVVNVITAENPPAYYEVTTSLRREGTGDNRQDNERHYGVEAMGSFFLNEHEFTVRGEVDDRGRRSPAGFVAIDPANPVQRVTGLNRSNGTDQRFELNALLALPQDSSLSLNGDFSTEDGASSPIDFEVADNGLGSIRETFSQQEEDRDIAAEYRRPLGSGASLMVALVDARSTEESQASLASASEQRRSVQDREAGETAARVMWTRTLTDELSLRLSATSAFNFIDGAFRLYEDGVELPVDGSDNRVEEDRRSLEASVDWNPRDRWTVRATLGAEAYEIESRNISSGMQTDPKGELSVSFRPRPRTTLRFETEHDIGQLSFGQFIASSSLSSEILTAGATALEPQRSSSHSVVYDRRFGDEGVLRFDVTRERVENPVESVALSDSVIVAQNTSPRTIDSIGASVEFPFQRIGRGDLILSANVHLADSQAIDPITGELREVSGVTDRFWSLGLRRDPGDSRLSWGFSARHRSNGDQYSVRRIRDSRESREWEAWVEWEPIDDLRLRTSFNGPSTRVQSSRFYGAVRTVGLEPSFISRSYRSVDSSASLSIEWRRNENFEISGYLSTSPEVRQEESLTPFGGPAGPILATRTVTTPRAQIRFRYFR